MDALAYVASAGGGSTRRRRDARIAAVLAEFGYRTYLPEPGDEAGLQADRLARVAEAAVVVCDLIQPGRDIPVEVAIAATRGTPVLALLPEDAPLEGWVADLLAESGAVLLRYSRAEPHHVLHATLGELAMCGSRLAALLPEAPRLPVAG